ncbi:MAG: phosphate signaling complex protein PhoU [bacterium]
MQRQFDEELKSLNMDLLKMATLSEQAIHKSIESLKNKDLDLARDIVANDTIIDESQIKIQKNAITLLALRQPLASDLRFIMTGVNIATSLERIADLAVNIAQRVIELNGKPLLKPLVTIPQLADLAKKMVKGAIDSFVNHDEKLAKEVILSDDEADNLRNVIQNELINNFLVKDGTTAPRAVPLLLIARHLERICDHAVGMAEEVIYMTQAKMVKHHPEILEILK